MRASIPLTILATVCISCTQQSGNAPRLERTVESMILDSVYIKSETSKSNGRLICNIVLWNDGNSPVFVRGDYYYVEFFGDERGVTLPAREWSGNVISRIHPSKYGSLGQNQVGPLVPRKALFLRVSPHGRTVLTVTLGLPKSLAHKDLSGDSISISIPYWKSIQPLEQFTNIHPTVDSFKVSDANLEKVDMKNYFSYTLQGDSIALNLDNISTMNSLIVNRLHTWSSIVR